MIVNPIFQNCFSPRRVDWELSKVTVIVTTLDCILKITILVSEVPITVILSEISLIALFYGSETGKKRLN